MDMFSALADPTRRSIVELLAASGQLSATDISDKFEMSAPAISQHLKVLREAKLVDMEKHAQQRIYQINPDTLDELDEWVTKLSKQWDARFDRLEKLLKTQKIKQRRLYARSK